MAIKLCLQKQVLKNANDIEDLQENQETIESRLDNTYTKGEIDLITEGLNEDISSKASTSSVYTKTEVNEGFATKTELENAINNVLVAEDTDYKTELVFEPDDVYLNYYDKDPENPQDFTWGLVQKCFQVDSLNDRHLYAHNIQMSVKFKNQGVTSDDYTGRIIFTIYNTSLTQFDETTIKTELYNQGRISATGFAIYTTNSTNYSVISINKYSDLVSTDIDAQLVILNAYAASGYITANIGEITDFTDKVKIIY